ncbi:MAG: hypothetical protein LBL94_02245 [Prevotellaceae bacterium]|nr:hypothetical protein [Prevotellaceae bacterium]
MDRAKNSKIQEWCISNCRTQARSAYVFIAVRDSARSAGVIPSERGVAALRYMRHRYAPVCGKEVNLPPPAA